MSEGHSGLVGSVVERKPSSKPTAPSFTPSATGFPAVQHRSKSLFARTRADPRANVTATQSRPREVPKVVPAPPVASNSEDWRDQISRENEARVASMTEDERQEEIKDILGRFGDGVGDVLRKAREARERGTGQLKATPAVHSAANKSEDSLPEVPLTASVSERRVSLKRVGSPPPALSTGHTRPNSRAENRKLRFAELSPQDVYVYESAPPSPKKAPLLLAPPDPSESGSSGAISLGTFKGTLDMSKGSLSLGELSPAGAADNEPSDDVEEGTPEYIRRRFFPHIPPGDPSLAWIEGSAPSSSSSTLRFDLSGTPIPQTRSATLPTHLGLHHHAEGSRAGYTLDDVFLLTRSSVPAQRTVMMGVLSGITRWLRRTGSDTSSANDDDGAGEIVGKEEELRKRILAAGVEAMNERGSLGARAIEVVWECVVGWDAESTVENELAERVELEDTAAKDSISSLPLEFLLPQLADIFALGALPKESSAQLLEIVLRLARHSNSIATSIAETSSLIASIAQRFLLTGTSASTLDQDTKSPDPRALELLITVASASRQNAVAIAGPADALLRFITTLPSSSPHDPTLAETLLSGTLRLYTILASYGMYASIATTAVEHFAAVGKYVASEECRSKVLIKRYLELIEAWTVCATDPHQTTPEHELLWSQVVGWAWDEDILRIRGKINESNAFSIEKEEDWSLWAAVWAAEASWLEGARINGVRGGEQERASAVNTIGDGFRHGQEGKLVERLVQTAFDRLNTCTSLGKEVEVLSGCASTLASAIRLWVVCLSPSSIVVEEPPYLLPFGQLSQLCAKLVTHPLWSWILDADAIRGRRFVHLESRNIATFLSMFSKMSRRLGASAELWMAQAFAIVTRLMPGNELDAGGMIEEAATLVTRDFIGAHGVDTPEEVWAKGGLAVLQPFLAHLLRPNADVLVAPVSPSPRSLKLVTTLRLPSPADMLRVRQKPFGGLPLSRDWPFSPLDHLLKSGSSPVWARMPPSWDASEVDVTRASLILALVTRQLLAGLGISSLALSREEVVFGCMKVFMLEHGQAHGGEGGSQVQEEVFRDVTVCRLMTDLLTPYTLAASPPHTHAIATNNDTETLETVAARFLGPSTPFYQYYTDLVALYDAVSFAHPVFARVLLAPTAMHYAPDFRRLLWCDYEHVLRTIRTPARDVPGASAAEYLWPVERDSQVLAAYVRALLAGKVEPGTFLRTVALHHVACSVWPDLGLVLGGEEKEEETEVGAARRETSVRMLKMLVFQGSLDLAREVAVYDCDKGDEPREQLREEKKAKRKAWLEGLEEQVFVERLGGLFEP
ncbi:hypothetical protein HGRIS_005591 [Hohenbuehelia grisea]|uniref:RNA polymerase II-associated protein 1 C-terminal domain-containing protein n=1 Tax=Hohenbuehelia grisea TaxID=104357 RepID=A0ABR3JZK3_9AGAR